MRPSEHEGLAHYLNQVRQQSEKSVLTGEMGLVLANLRLAIHIAKKYARDPEDLLDKIQDGNCGLLHAAKTYDPSKGSFSNWAGYYITGSIRNRFTDSFGGLLNNRRTNTLQALPLDELEPLAANDDLDEQLMLASAGRMLTQRQRQVVAGRLAGYTYQELADELGCSHQSIQCVEKNALKKIQAL